MNEVVVKTDKVSAWELAAFAAPAAPLLALTLPTIVFLPPHFEQHLGLSGYAVAAIFFIARIFDIFIDPSLGTLQDRVQTPWGRRRFWLVAACPFLMAMVWWVFTALGRDAGPVIAAGSIFLLFFMLDMMMVAHLSWSGEIIPTYHGRTHALGAVQTASAIGQALMLVIAAYVVQGRGGTDADAVSAMGWSIFWMLPITVLLAVFIARERKAPPQPHLTFRAAFDALLHNKPARRVLLPDLMLGIAQGVSGGLFLFYFQFVLGFARESQTLVAVYFLSGIVGVPVWWTIGRRFSKHRATQWCFLYAALTTLLLPFMPHGNFPVVAFFMLLGGLSQGGCVLLTRALMADVVDEDEVATGLRRSGLYFGLLLMTSKAGLAAGPIALGALQPFGFTAALGAHNSAAALTALGAIFVGVPVALYVFGALSLRNYPLDEKRQTELATAIIARQGSENA